MTNPKRLMHRYRSDTNNENSNVVELYSAHKKVSHSSKRALQCTLHLLPCKACVICYTFFFQHFSWLSVIFSHLISNIIFIANNVQICAAKTTRGAKCFLVFPSPYLFTFTSQPYLQYSYLMHVAPQIIYGNWWPVLLCDLEQCSG